MDTLTVKQKVIIAIILGFLVGFWMGSAGGRIGEPEDTRENPEEHETIENGEEEDGDEISEGREDVRSDIPSSDQETTQATVPVASTNNIAVEDQTAGNTVTVASVQLGQATWLVVYESAGGELGNILGARRLAAGEHTNAEVRLLRGTIAGEQYAVVLHESAGGAGFDHATDTPILVNGQMIKASFNTLRIDPN